MLSFYKYANRANQKYFIYLHLSSNFDLTLDKNDKLKETSFCSFLRISLHNFSAPKEIKYLVVDRQNCFMLKLSFAN